MKIIFTDSRLFNNSAEYMGWKVGNKGFEMMLSSNLPKIISDEAVPAIEQVLYSHGLTVNSINHWALHPAAGRF